MANEIYNSSYWGNGVCDNAIDWGVVYKDFAGCTPSFTNTYSLAFDGVDDKIQFESIALGSDYTLSAWAKRLSTANMFLFGNSQTFGYGAYFNGTSNLYFKETNTDLITFNNTAIQTALARTDWVNWVFKKDSNAGTVSVYVDGVLAESTSSVKGMSTITTIGGSGLSSGTQYIWNGNIDEVAIFNTSSVSLDDLGSSTTPKDLSSISGLTAWYRNGDNGSYKSPQWLIPNNINVANSRISNYSLQLDGVDNYVNLGNNADFNTNDTISVSVWFKTSDDTTPTQQIFSKTFYRLQIQDYFGGSRIVWVVYHTSGSLKQIVASGTEYADGQWHHALCVYESNKIGGMTLHVDGVLIGSADTSTQIHTSTNPLLIGVKNTSSQQALDGSVDELAFWTNNQSANVASIYNSGTPADISSLSPISHWKMGEEATFSTNWTVPDQVGSSNGTSANMTIEDRIGDASNSSNNAVSFNQVEADRKTDVPT